MRFLLDMGVHLGVLHWLREQSHEAIHLRDEGLNQLPDRDIFDKAISENRIVLAFDLDFGEVASHTRGRRASVIIFRLRNTRVDHVIARLSAVLLATEQALVAGAIVIVEDARYRVRHYSELS